MIDLPPASPVVLNGQQLAVEAALRESEERFAAVWDATSEAMALSDRDGVVLAANPAYCALYGRPAAEIVGRSFEVIFPETLRAEALQQYREVFANPDPPRSYEARVQRPDGSERAVEARADFLVRDGRRIAMISAIRDITARKRLERAQQDFVAMASHDLASPVTVVRGRAQLMQRRKAYDEDSIASILEQTTRMERLISDLRDLVQVESGGFPMQRSPVDLAALAHDAAERTRAIDAGRAVRMDAPEMPAIVVGDRDRLGQVLDNLLGNAVKYSPKGGEILVRVELAGAEARLSVSDQGSGVPADVLPHLFDRFYRGNHAASTTGLGLGLYISRMLVEAHGGRIWAKSEPGAGSTFTISLPLDQTADS
jgi:PAS domain S-box-containing protein